MKMNLKTWFKVYILRQETYLNAYFNGHKSKSFVVHHFTLAGVPDDALIIETCDLIELFRIYRAIWVVNRKREPLSASEIGNQSGYKAITFKEFYSNNTT